MHLHVFVQKRSQVNTFKHLRVTALTRKTIEMKRNLLWDAGAFAGVSSLSDQCFRLFQLSKKNKPKRKLNTLTVSFELFASLVKSLSQTGPETKTLKPRIAILFQCSKLTYSRFSQLRHDRTGGLEPHCKAKAKARET